jgi:hypothetical protein
MDTNAFRNPAVRKTFIVSGGRTATMLFGNRLNESFGDVFSVHEPDVVELTRHGVAASATQLARQGLLRMGLLKALGRAGTRNLSLARLTGRLDHDQVIEWFLKDRRHLGEIGSPYYVEANAQLFGITEDLLRLPNANVVLVIRDPRTWIESWLKKKWYSDRDLLTRLDVLGFKRITPGNVGAEMSAWEGYSRVEKLAWVWGFLAASFARLEAAHPDVACVVRFEDVLGADPAIDKQRMLVGRIFGEDEVETRLETFQRMILQKDNATPRHPVDVVFPTWFTDEFSGLLQQYGYA